jgi:pimeloyl-ACP methyl ester carboxylesterase
MKILTKVLFKTITGLGCSGAQPRRAARWAGGLLVCLGLPLMAPAQTRLLTGRTLDSRQQPVPFATVAVPGTPLGTAADAEGNFRLAVPDTLRSTARVVASAVGYVPATARVGAFGAAAPLPLLLVDRPVSLTEVVIRPGRELLTVGPLRDGKALTSALYEAGNLVRATGRREAGSLLAVEQAAELQDFNFQVAFNTFREVRVRLRLYRVEQGRPTTELVPAGIPLVVSQKRGWVSVDLREFGLHCAAGQAVAATLHWERDTTTALHRHAFVLAARSGRRLQYLSRAAPDAPWQLTKGSAPVCYFTASTAATGQPLVAPAPPRPAADGAAEEPSPLFRLMRAARFPPRSSRHYGDSTARGRTVPVAGARLYYETYGQGEPLLLLHGNGQSIAAWHLQIAALARHFRVLAVDTRGHGRSLDETTTELTYGLLAEDVRQLLDALQLRRVRVLGWSDGANTALHLARQAPDYVSALVLVSANLTPEALDPPLLAFLQQQLAPLPPTSAAARWHRLLLQEPLLGPTDLAGLRVPTLVLAGQHDVILEAHTRALAAAISGARLHIFPGASHFSPHEQPQEFNARVLEFLGVQQP